MSRGPGAREERQATAGGTVRGTQWFVAALSWCWRHPSVTALEVMWRWMIGAPVLWVVGRQVQRVLLEATGGTYDWSRLGLDHLTVVDPVGAAKELAMATSVLLPQLLGVARWVAPPLLVAWIAVSSVGRTVVLRRADARLRSRVGTLVVLQVVRVLALAGSFAVWFVLLVTVGARTVTRPMAVGEEPDLLLYFAVAIVGTLGLFTMWALVSWVLGVAPLLAMLDDTGPWASLRGATRLGPLRLKLVEINLVMGIVKIALLVLAMVFSATPLPFESVITQEFLLWWTVAVALVYFVASDFFHVARLVNYLQLWRSYETVDGSQPVP